MAAKLLWIEGRRAESPSFIPGLRKKGLEIVTVSTGTEALARLSEMKPDMVILNAASMRSSGRRICRSIHSAMEGLPILVISDPAYSLDGEDCASVILELPFTIRKLVNRIMPLLPRDEENTIMAGPIQLNLEHRQVRCQDREAVLTPRLVNLLQMMMEHVGEVIERERLFREVWKTEYTADTRTLDVHISWLRKAIEVDPRRPKFLKTVRGVGYRLDIQT